MNNVCEFVYLTLFFNHSVNNFISALDHFRWVQIRGMKWKAIARLWRELQELITRDRLLTATKTHSASWNCLSECLDYKIMLQELDCAHSYPFCSKVSLFPSSNLQTHKLWNLYKWHMQIHFQVKRTPLLTHKDKTPSAVYENVPCLLKETHKTHKCNMWRKYLDVDFRSVILWG